MLRKTAIYSVPKASRLQAVKAAVGAGGSITSQIRTLATPAKAPSPNDAFANGTNAYYAEEMYRLWRQDPKSVHASWDVYFSGMDKGLSSSQAFQPPPNLTTVPMAVDGAPSLHLGGGQELTDHLKVRLLFLLPKNCCSRRHHTGPTPRQGLPSSRSPHCRPRPPRCS